MTLSNVKRPAIVGTSKRILPNINNINSIMDNSSSEITLNLKESHSQPHFKSAIGTPSRFLPDSMINSKSLKPKRLKNHE